MEQDFSISVVGEKEEGDDYSLIHVIITTFQNITPEVVKTLSKQLYEILPASDIPFNQFTVSQITNCSDLVYVQFSGELKDFKLLKKFADSEKFYKLIQPVLEGE